MAAPDWLIVLLDQAVRRLGWRQTGWIDGMAVLVDDRGEESRFGLDNVERRLAHLPDDERLDRLEQYLRGLRSVRPTDDLAAARERLLVRLRPDFEEGDLSKHVWSAPLGETGLIQVLVIDHPDAMAYVTHDMVEGSGRTGEEWLAFALDNLRAVTEPGLLVELEEGDGVMVCGTGDAYDAARALVLERLFDEPEPAGYVVSVPTRDRLLVYPVDADLIGNRFVQMLIATWEMHLRDPYPISDGIFWIHDGEWEPIDYEYREGGELSATLPFGLSELLEDEEDEE